MEFSEGAGKSLDELLEDFLSNQLSYQTKRAYEGDVRQFFAKQGLTHPKDVTLSHVTCYRNSLAAGCKPATIARKLTVLRQFFEFCVGIGLLSKNPAKAVKSPKVPQYSNTNGLTKEEAELLLRQPDRNTVIGKRDYSILCLMLHNGLRRSEVANIKWEDFGEARDRITLTIHGKGGKVNMTKVKASVMQGIQEYIQASGRVLSPESPLFTATKRSDPSQAEKPISAETIYRIVKKYVKMAGIKKRISPHSLRHTSITLCLDGGGSLRQAQHLARHDDPRTTMRYDRNRFDLDNHGTDYIRLDT